MHKYFADWYRIAAIEPHPDVLEKRWEGVQGIVYSLDVADVLEVARLFHGAPRTDGRFVERYRDAFKACDVTFQMRDNDAELRVLAGATIVSLLGSRVGPMADLGALAMLCPDCRGLRHGDRLPDMLREARSYLLGRSAGLRASRNVRTMAIPTLDVESVLEPLQSALQAKQTRDPDFAGALEPIPLAGPGRPASALEIVMKGMQRLASGVLDVAAAAAEVTREQAERLRLLREESNMLWWLFAEYSRDLGQRMATVPLSAACLVAGKELADLTEVLPGPLAAIGVLDRMLRAVEPELRSATTLQEAVNETPREWRPWMAGGDCERVEDLCPVLYAVRRSLDTNGPEDWIPPVRKVTGVDALTKISPLDLAVQAYEERLFVAAFKEASAL